MILRKIALPTRDKQEFLAVIRADEKFLQDEIDIVWDKMLSMGYRKANYKFGPFVIELVPKQDATA